MLDSGAVNNVPDRSLTIRAQHEPVSKDPMPYRWQLNFRARHARSDARCPAGARFESSSETRHRIKDAADASALERGQSPAPRICDPGKAQTPPDEFRWRQLRLQTEQGPLISVQVQLRHYLGQLDIGLPVGVDRANIAPTRLFADHVDATFGKTMWV